MMAVYETTQRDTVQARFTDGRVFEAQRGTTLEEFVLAADPEAGVHNVAALVNGKLRELCLPLMEDADVVPLGTDTSDGSRIYRRSLTFLLIAAAAEVFPDQPVTIHHSMPFGGYYCEREGGVPLTDAELGALRDRMQALVDADLAISPVRVPLAEALDLFRAQGDAEKAELFARRRKDYVTLYELNGVRDNFHGFMVPRTSYLNLFDLRHYRDGFILQFPRRQWPDALQPFEDEPRLAQVFQDYSEWLGVMGVSNVTALNRAIQSGRTREIILVAESLHQRQTAAIAHQIAEHTPAIRMVSISGPTSAGKTTLSKRLSLQLMARGVFPVIIALDDYFVDRKATPRDETGEYDFESLEAVDLPLFQQHMAALVAGESVVLPRFNFMSGLREPGKRVQIGPQHVLIIEGIHGLNPRLTQGIDDERIYRIFVSAFTQLNLDKHNRVPTTDTRLLRRIVRDAAYRGYSASDTISRWASVRRGEKRHIFPYQHHANVFFNSALVYEMSVLKLLAKPLILQVEAGTPERLEANRLLAFLQWFETVPQEHLMAIPNQSILREFTGGSILADFEPSLWYAT